MPRLPSIFEALDTEPRSLRPPAIGAVLVLLLAVLYLAAREAQPEASPASPTPIPGLEATGTELQMIPAVPDEVSTAVREELAAFLDDLYERAFLPPLPAPTPEPDTSIAPTPVPRPPVEELFTVAAAGALKEAPDAFRPDPGERVESGTVTFEGIASVSDGEGAEAMLDVTFEATGRLVHAHGLKIQLSQTGQLLCIKTPDGWRIAGFDVELAMEHEVAPTADPRDRAISTERSVWWQR